MVSNRRAITLAVGLLLFVPSLWAGFMLDDFHYLGAIEGRFPQHNTKRSLFTFFINDEKATTAIAREGGYPWWIDERVTGESFRPLSDLLLRGDYRLYGKKAFGYHVHSLVWWIATLLACGLLYRRTLPGVIGVLAFLLFAVDDTHVMPVAWISNRNALVALAPMLVGLWAWIRWCEDTWRPGLFLALAGIIVGMAGSELSLAALAYFIAYTLIGGPGTAMRSRLRRLAPIVGLGIAYAVVYRILGFSSSYSGAYHDPLLDPTGFLKNFVTSVPALLASGIAGFSADAWFAAPSLHGVQIALGCIAVLILLGVLRVCWSDLDEPIRRAVRWLLTGSALSLIPAAAVFPSDRMVLVPGIGLTAAVAIALVEAFRSWRARRRWLLVGVGGILAVIHLLLAPLFAVGIQALLVNQNRRALALAASPVVVDAGGKDTILVFAPDHVVSLYMPRMIDYLGNPAPKSWRPLSIAPYDHWLRRTGPRTLELEVAKGGVMLRSIFEVLYRDPRNPLARGAVIDRGLFRAEIMDANNRGSTRVAFHFNRDLTDPTLCFLVWRDGELRPAHLPAVGEEMFIKRTLGPGGF